MVMTENFEEILRTLEMNLSGIEVGIELAGYQYLEYLLLFPLHRIFSLFSHWLSKLTRLFKCALQFVSVIRNNMIVSVCKKR